MQHNKLIIIRKAMSVILILSAMILPVMLSLSAALAEAKASGLEVPGLTEAASGWKLKEARVICSGETTVIGDGALTGGHVIEATAIPMGRYSSTLGKGRFRITLTAFLPNQSLPGQKPEHWEVRGIWSITNESTTKNARGVSTTLTVARGNLFSELPFNPVKNQGIVNALVTLVMSPPHRPLNGGGQRFTRGQGTFLGNERFDGFIFISTGSPGKPGGEGIAVSPGSPEAPETSEPFEPLPGNFPQGKGVSP